MACNSHTELIKNIKALSTTYNDRNVIRWNKSIQNDNAKQKIKKIMEYFFPFFFFFLSHAADHIARRGGGAAQHTKEGEARPRTSASVVAACYVAESGGVYL